MQSPNWSEARLKSLLGPIPTPESLQLEYKRAAKLSGNSANEEISKFVSAMANSAGGTIIIGIACEDPTDKTRPTSLDPVDLSAYTDEWLENVITGNIHPHIQGLTIHALRTEADPKMGYYVIEVPPTQIAHQAADKRYYRRHNCKAVPMLDHEIRDVMNRQKVAAVSVAVFFHLEERNNHRVWCKLKNESGVFARYASIQVRVPLLIQGSCLKFGEGADLRTGEDGLTGYILTPQKPVVLFPHSFLEYEWAFRLHRQFVTGAQSLDWVEITAFADSMPPHRRRFELNQIVTTPKTRMVMEAAKS